MKRKVVLYFMFLIVLTLTLVMVFFGIGIKRYFYQEISDTVKNYTEAVLPVWTQQGDFTSLQLTEQSDAIIKAYKMDDAALSLLTRNGQMIQSSTGYLVEKTESIDPEVLRFHTVYNIEKTENSDEKIMAVYTPLLYEGQIAGVLKYEVSMTDTDARIYKLLSWGLVVCMLVAFLVFLVSFQLGNSIVKPLKSIIMLTKRMAEGNYNKKIEQSYPHEAGELVDMLNYMADEITKADHMKNDFISSISHELRTPLTGIKGWAETMRDPEGLTEDEMKFGLKIIDEETERLISLVESLLDFSRYQSDRMSLSLSFVPFDKLIEKVTFELLKKAEKKNIHLITETTPVVIEADWDKLKQVVLNVLDNAIKFSPKSSDIVITQTVEDHCVSLVIRDAGIGVKAEHLKYLTQSFYKADKKSVGEGLGLAISRKIMTLHGGTLSIESEYGRGTTVTLNLPRKQG
ncbi:Alkaline phosphatase synthesis sensor protein PhoR [Clostridium sp. C105KSO15]|nr:Alkaline phosphatase synthesis sensor protein PhoR [Clostridium sp. C105KSO15]